VISNPGIGWYRGLLCCARTCAGLGLVEGRVGVTTRAGTLGGAEDDDNTWNGDGVEVPWASVGSGEVAGLMVEYRQAVEAAELVRYVHTYKVAPFLRRLPDGQSARPAQQAEYRKLLARFGRVGDLPAGHTLVRGHTRERAR
jgi:hypothetical protein